MRTLSVLFGVIALLGCSRNRPATIPVTEVGATNSFTLVTDRESVSGLSLHVQGHLDGTGYIHAANWPTQALSGAVDWRIYHDWFEKRCVIYYRPVGVHSGNLLIHYEFH